MKSLELRCEVDDDDDDDDDDELVLLYVAETSCLMWLCFHSAHSMWVLVLSSVITAMFLLFHLAQELEWKAVLFPLQYVHQIICIIILILGYLWG